MKFSFVIPTYNNYKLLHQTFWDIYRKCSLVDEVLVVDDASTDEDVANGIKWWKSRGLLPIRHIRLNKNVMFLRASNIGLQKAEGDIVCLLSNDVRLHKNIVEDISMALGFRKPTLVGGRLLDWDTGWNTFDGRIFPYLEGWLLATHKDGWKDLGYFEEQFAPPDMEDVDLSATAKHRGYRLYSLPSDATTHLGGQSIGFNPAREAITIANKEKFRQKWMNK